MLLFFVKWKTNKIFKLFVKYNKNGLKMSIRVDMNLRDSYTQFAFDLYKIIGKGKSKFVYLIN